MEGQSSSTTNRVLFALGAGVAVGATVAAVWYGYRRYQFVQQQIESEYEEDSLIDKRKEKKKKGPQEEYVCECGKTISEGGCPPGYNSELLVLLVSPIPFQ